MGRADSSSVSRWVCLFIPLYYFAVGVRLVWVIYPEKGRIYTYTSPEDVAICSGDKELTAAPVLPELKLTANALFEGITQPQEKQLRQT